MHDDYSCYVEPYLDEPFELPSGFDDQLHYMIMNGLVTPPFDEDLAVNKLCAKAHADLEATPTQEYHTWKQ